MIRKACLTNREMSPVYHPGAYKDKKWTCCRVTISMGKTPLVNIPCYSDEWILTLTKLIHNITVITCRLSLVPRPLSRFIYPQKNIENMGVVWGRG